MKDNKGNLYDVHYRDKDDQMQCVTYFGYSKDDAERLFKTEQREGEELVKIVRQ